jgi:RNA polymerase sigma-70 factor (ECF subfamily)
MDLAELLKTKTFLDEISVSIRNILLASFPQITAEEKEDIDHEVKLKLWKNIEGGKKIHNLRSYLWRVVYTTALDLLAEKKHFVPLEEILRQSEGDGNAPEELLSAEMTSTAKEYRLMVERALDTLPERRRAVVKLHLAGQDLPRIASSLSWRENQVRHLLYRGLADLRKRLKTQTSRALSEKRSS